MVQKQEREAQNPIMTDLSKGHRNQLKEVTITKMGII